MMPSRFGRALRILWKTALGALLLSAVLLFLCVKDILPWPHRTIELKKIRATEGFGFTAKLPPCWPGFVFVSESAVMSEDGRTLSRVNENGIVREQGMGRFRAGSQRVLFSASDGTDPPTNGRKYKITLETVVVPKIRVSILLAGIVAALLLFRKHLIALATWMRRAMSESAGHAPVVSAKSWAFTLFAGALAVRVGFLVLNPDYTDQMFSIRGTPDSDARDWNRMAKSTATGFGVDAPCPGMRALYPIFLAHFYTWFGDSLTLAKALQALIGAASAALVFLTLRRAMVHWVAFAAALFFAADPRQVTQTGRLMTEPFGLLLTLLSAWCLLIGGERRRPAMLFASGAFFACSNLARPLTLFALPLFVALVALNARQWRTAAVHAAAFVFGTLICLGPWIVRERIVHGIWGISSNSAEALFTASTPEFGTWGPGAERVAAEEGIRYRVKDRYDFFQSRFHRNLKEYPGFYAGNVARGFLVAAMGCVNALSTMTGVWIGAFTIACGIAAWHGGARPALAIALPAFAGLLALVSANSFLATALVGTGIVFTLWWRLFPGAVLVVCHLGALLGTALFGNPDLQRMRLLIDWLEAGWMFAGLLAVGSITIGLLLRLPIRAVLSRPAGSDRVLVDESAPRWLRAMGWGFASFITVSAGRLVFLNSIMPPAPVPVATLTDAKRTAFLQQLAVRAPVWQLLADPALMAVESNSKRRVFVGFVSIEKDAYHFPAGVGFQHWSTHFEARPHEYTSFIFAVVGRSLVEGVYAEFAGNIPPALRETPCLLVGLTRIRTGVPKYLRESVETIAIIPAPDLKPDMANALIAPITPDTQALLDALTGPPQ